MNIITLDKITKSYGKNNSLCTPLKEIDLKIDQAEFTAIVGPSGSGKTTLLNIMSGLDSPTDGKADLLGQNLAEFSEEKLADFRRDYIGFIFQSYNLIPVLTVYENIEYSLALQKISSSERKIKVKTMLNELGLNDMENRFPGELSGGQQQRVAVARALITQPKVIFADEPTANLDSNTAIKLIELMKNLNQKSKVTFIFSTHDDKIMNAATRVIKINDGIIISDSKKI